jgi:hypothetical protein
MQPKFKKGDELRSINDFKKMVVEKADVRIYNAGETDEKASVCYWNELDKGKESRRGYDEEHLTKVDCTKALLKAKQLIKDNKYSFKLFDEETEANKIVEQSLKSKFYWELAKYLDECIQNATD